MVGDKNILHYQYFLMCVHVWYVFMSVNTDMHVCVHVKSGIDTRDLPQLLLTIFIQA